MDVVYQRCCGWDVHQKTVAACLVVAAAGGKKRKEIRRLATVTGELLPLADWLSEQGVTHVAREASGV